MFGQDTTIVRLLKKSSKALDIFTKTSNELREINEEVVLNIQSRDEEIKRINEEKARLAEVLEGNSKIIEKIQKLLE